MSEEVFYSTECKQCGVNIEFPAEGVGLTTSCPECNADVILEVNRGASRKQIPISQNAKTLNVTSYRDNPDGTTTNFLSDGSQETGRLSKNADGTYSFNPTDSGVQSLTISVQKANSYQFSSVSVEELTEWLTHYLKCLTIDDLFDKVIERVEGECGKKAVEDTLTAIWALCSVLTEKEILGIADLKPAGWAPIRNALDEALLEADVNKLDTYFSYKNTLPRLFWSVLKYQSSTLSVQIKLYSPCCGQCSNRIVNFTP